MMCIAFQSCQAVEECQEFHNKWTTLLLQTQQLPWSLSTPAHSWSQHDQQVGIQWNCCRDFCFCCSKAYRKNILIQEGDYSYNRKKVLSWWCHPYPSFYLPQIQNTCLLNRMKIHTIAWLTQELWDWKLWRWCWMLSLKQRGMKVVRERCDEDWKVIWNR